MKYWLKVIGINIAVLLGCLVLAELIFGNWVFGPDYREMNIPRNTVRVFNVDRIYPGGDITYTRDEHGLRGAYENVGNIDIMTLGGSTTNQLYVDDAKTWQAVLRDRFAAAGKPVSVVNAGLDGQTTVGHIAGFHLWFPLVDGLRARFVLVYAGINDVGVEAQVKYDEMRSPDPRRRLVESLKNKSAIYNLYKTVKGMMAAFDADVVHGSRPASDQKWEKWRPLDPDPDLSADMTERIEAYADRLRALAREIRDFGAKAIFVTQPSAEHRLRDGWVLLPINDKRQTLEKAYIALNAFNRTTMQVCRELDAICIDLARGVKFEDEDFYDRIHNTDKGAEKIGRYLFEALKPYL